MIDLRPSRVQAFPSVVAVAAIVLAAHLTASPSDGLAKAAKAPNRFRLVLAVDLLRMTSSGCWPPRREDRSRVCGRRFIICARPLEQ